MAKTTTAHVVYEWPTDPGDIFVFDGEPMATRVVAVLDHTEDGPEVVQR
ncbi:hypothetical protein [Nocardia sp. 852002-51101_SCH5132738]|nr:hypothetical protein [Nocardia sp. 852002-51101_SCH5132738]